MKRLISVLTSFMLAAFFAVPVCAAPSAEIGSSLKENDISARSAVLIEANSGRVIWGKSENTRLPMASTTKIMTTIIALESGDLDTEFTVDSAAVHTEGSSMGLREGDIVSLRDLCIGMLLPSGNDAANSAAVRLGGDIPTFAGMMNSKAAELGLSDTHFVTPSGLHDPEHYSTAYDMSRLAAYALKDPDFAAICGEQTIKLSFGDPPYDRWLTNTNKLLGQYGGCIGVKTGFTDEAGRCLVSAAERDGVRLVCVTLNAPDDWNDHAKLYDHGFSRTILREYTENIEYFPALAGGIGDSVRLVPERTPTYTEIIGQTSDISHRMIAPPMLYAPLQAGKACGEVVIYDCGREIDRIPLAVAESAAAAETSETSPPEKSLKHKIIDFFKDLLFR